MKHPQVNASHSSRNAGLVAVGAMIAMVFFQIIGYYAVLISFVSGACCYANDRVQDNSPSKFDPLYTLAGGVLVAAFMYASNL
jgi:hypothetical protein